jgi:hypothetical protein
MRKYTVQGINQAGTGPNTAVNIIGASTIRPLCSEIFFGFRTAPAATDQQVRKQVGRTTAVGTAGSNPTPLPLDPQDVAGQCTAAITHSGEPTYGATFLHDSDLNQRGSYRWVAEIGFEWAGSATASNGLGAKMTSDTGGVNIQMSANIQYKE